jgi:hypothetical protein
MVKKESYREPLNKLIDEFLKTANEDDLTKYLTVNSNLPGPRGNLELADAFSDVIKEYSSREPEKLWSLSMKLIRFSPNAAPTDNPKEFLVFCGARIIGALGSSVAFFEKAMVHLKELATDSRWRTREGVAMALQDLIEKSSKETLKELEKWIESGNWLVMRAVAAGVAEPALLKEQKTAQAALYLHKQIVVRITTAEEHNLEFKTLRQGLGYSLSVIVCAVPKGGFEFMRQLAGSKDADILWIVKENIKKNRLIKNFPKEISEINELLK